MPKERFSSLTSGRYVARIKTPIDPKREEEFARRYGPRPISSVQRHLVDVLTRIKENLGIRV